MKRASYMYICSSLLACTLIGSFFLHALQITHTHHQVEHEHSESKTPGFDLMDTSEYMHLVEKKMLVFVVSVFFVFVSLAYIRVWSVWHLRSLFRINIYTYRSGFSSFLDLYRIGILNPKLF